MLTEDQAAVLLDQGSRAVLEVEQASGGSIAAGVVPRACGRGVTAAGHPVERWDSPPAPA